MSPPLTSHTPEELDSRPVLHQMYPELEVKLRVPFGGILWCIRRRLFLSAPAPLPKLKGAS